MSIAPHRIGIQSLGPTSGAPILVLLRKRREPGQTAANDDEDNDNGDDYALLRPEEREAARSSCP